MKLHHRSPGRLAKPLGFVLLLIAHMVTATDRPGAVDFQVIHVQTSVRVSTDVQLAVLIACTTPA
jgi:hypothetical protein